jgi:thioesterase domain-containing protein
VAFQLKGSLNVGALTESLRGIVVRHDVLRATFAVVDGQPVQRIAPDAAVALPVVDLSNIPPEARQARIHELAAEQATGHFDLTRGPLWRLELIQCSSDEHVLLVTMHHIVSDGWSFYILCQELTELYRALCAGEPPRLADLPIQYADLALRQHARLTGPFHDEQLAYWRKHLAGDVPSLRLPTDHRESSGPSSHRGACRSLEFPPDLSESLAQLSRQENVTLFMTLLAGFQALLHQYTGQDDMVICTPVTGRHRSGSRDLIGYFNNILPMRFDLSGDPSLVELLRRTRRIALDAFKYQDLPFLIIVDSPGLNHVALARVLFSLDMAWPPVPQLVDLAVTASAVPNATADFDLSASLWVTETGRLKGTIEYKAALFEEGTIAELISHFQSVVTRMVSDPTQAISTLPRFQEPGPDSRIASVAPAPTVYTAPRTALEVRVTKVWEEILSLHPIGIHQDLFALGASSLAVIRLADRLKEDLNAEVPLAAIFQARTIEQLTGLLRESGTVLPASPLVALKPDGNRPPIFFCGGVGLYYPLTRFLGPEQPIYALFTEVTQSFPQMAEIAEGYIVEMRTVQPRGPYFLGGASIGGLIALEMAQQLHSQGQDVAFLALIDTPGPGAYTAKPLPARLVGHLRNVRKFGLSYARKKAVNMLRRLGWALSDRLASPRRASSRMAPEQPRVRDVLANAAALYQVRPYHGRATLFALTARDGMSDSLFDPELGQIDPYLGWTPIARGGVDLHEVPGEHVSVFHEPYVSILGDKLRECLVAAQSRVQP